MKKKFIYTLIIAVMAGSLFTGCSKSEQPKEDVTIETTMAGETDNNESSDQPEQTAEADNTQNSEESNQNTSSDQPTETENATTSEKAETTTKNETTKPTETKPTESTQKPTENTQKPTESTKNPTKTETTTTKEPEKTHTHSYTSSVIKEATCTTKGVKTYTCSCGDSYTEDIAKTSHTAGDWTVTKNATCKETGTKVKKCTVCGTQMETANVEKTGHISSDWVTTKAATCSTNGTKVKKCTVCGVETANETIVANGTHNYYWDGDNTMRTHRCSGCSYTGVTEYNINGAWGYFDDNSAATLWNYVNNQRNKTETLERDPEGNPIQIINVPSLIQSSELMALAKTRAAEAAKNFSHGSYSNECLAWGQGSPEAAMDGWGGSSTHLRAITNPDYKTGGIAVFYFDSNNSGINLTPIYCLELGY